MTLIATAFCLLAVTNFGSAAGIRLSEKSQEFTLEDVVHFGRKVESVDVETRTIDPSIEEDAGLSVPELIVKYGYGVEVHHVVTSDGYILEVHRMTSSPKCQNVSLTDKQPVFLMHGLSGASSSFVLMGPHNALSYLLADKCYDVWMGNARGNRYSRRHIHFDPDGDRTNRRNFFDFSWHETGVYDMPAMINHVLNKSRFKRMHYVGHSQGTTVFFVMNSELPEYNDKFISMHALAPVSFWVNQNHPVLTELASNWSILASFFRLLGIYEFMMDGSDLGVPAPPGNPAQHNFTMQPVIDGHNPAGTGTNNVVHYGQNVASGRFRKFDHGTLGNLRRYGTAEPPDYNVHKITAPIALHYSLNDWLVDIFDVYKLYESLPNPIGLFQVPDPLFTHGDFIFAIDTRPLLYNRILEIMRDFESKP